jgi:predicted DNA-binding transcriptional regulator YafY
MPARTGELSPLSPPDSVYVRQRWIKAVVVEWVQDADTILMDYGAVRGTVRHTYNSARWHAQKLIQYMVELKLHERWELKEHVERRGEGWLWSVEYCGNGRIQQ